MSTSEDKPVVLFVDDNTDELSGLSEAVRAAGAASSAVLFPSDVDIESLKSADLVVVDLTLDTWIDGVTVDEIALRPVNGIALAAVLRQHTDDDSDFPPTGFALITGKPLTLGPVPSERRPHVLSRLNNVEWFFEKGTVNPAHTATQIISLASAIHSLPESVGMKLGTVDSLMDFLAVGDTPLRDRYRNAIERCRPPIHHLAARSHGLVILRWMLHRILPHTAFLRDEINLAARLCVTPESLEQELGTNGGLKQLLSDYEYRGPLHDFDGRRWWREGIEQYLWEITDGDSTSPESIRGALVRLGCTRLIASEHVRPIPTVDHELRTERELASLDDVVPLWLDDWPSYAEPAYAKLETVAAHEEMRMFVAGVDAM